MIGIYKFTNRYNRKCYIGQSKNIELRYKQHEASIKYNKTTPFINALKRYGINAFDFNVLIECPKENLNYWEKFYIRYYCSNNPDWGYNITNGGNNIPESRNGLSDEDKQKQSIIQKKRFEDPNEHIKLSIAQKKRFEDPNEHIKLSIAHKGQIPAMKGKHHSDATKEKLRQANLGKKQSKEAIEKRKETLKEKGYPFKNKHHTEETINKIKNTSSGKHYSVNSEWKPGHIPWNKGMKGQYTKKKK